MARREARLTLAALAVAGCAHAGTCYEVYAQAGALVYRADEAPVDMSRPIAPQLAALGWADHHLVHYPDSSGGCAVPAGMLRPAVGATAQPGDVKRAMGAALNGLAVRNAPPPPTPPMEARSDLFSECEAGVIHTGPRGGQYCITNGGQKRYVGRRGR